MHNISEFLTKREVVFLFGKLIWSVECWKEIQFMCNFYGNFISNKTFQEYNVKYKSPTTFKISTMLTWENHFPNKIGTTFIRNKIDKSCIALVIAERYSLFLWFVNCERYLSSRIPEHRTIVLKTTLVPCHA